MIGKVNKTDEFCHEDKYGRWHRSELSAEMGQKPTWMDAPSMIAALKELYADSEVIRDLVYKQNPLLKLVDKK